MITFTASCACGSGVSVGTGVGIGVSVGAEVGDDSSVDVAVGIGVLVGSGVVVATPAVSWLPPQASAAKMSIDVVSGGIQSDRLDFIVFLLALFDLWAG
jgi:hypothetical protein